MYACARVFVFVSICLYLFLKKAEFMVTAQLNPLVSECKVGTRARKHMGILSSDAPVVIKVDLAIQDFKLDGVLRMNFIKGQFSPIRS